MAQADPQLAASETEDKAQELKKWGQLEVVKVQKHCLSNGIQFKGFKKEKCLNIPPIIAIWYVLSDKKGEDFWVISGEFPTDVAPVSVAKDPRDATRYFSMSWQLKAARMEDALAEGKIQLGDKDTQQKVVEDLVKKAEILGDIHRDEKLWKGSGLEIK